MLHTYHYTLHEIAPYINWLYFFHAWGFPSRLASIAKVHGCEACRTNWLMAFADEERERARQAIQLYDDAQHLLGVADAHIKTHAVVGLFPANGQEDDIVIKKEGQTIRIPFLRQQTPDSDGICLCLSDFVKPKEKGEDMIGIFACSTDKELEEGEKEDEYRHLLRQTLADRLAEATAERMHERVRKELWAFASDEKLTIEEMFTEKYQGKRPAVGYPSMPDQSLNFLLSDIVGYDSIGVSLTESGAMRPHASTSGIILSHPATQHFSVGKIEKDQLLDYAKRRGMRLEEIQRFFR